MLINKSAISSVFIGLKTVFDKAFQDTPTQWQQTAMLVPSSASQNDYAWISQFPSMRKWVGEKYFKVLAAFKYSVITHKSEIWGTFPPCRWSNSA